MAEHRENLDRDDEESGGSVRSDVDWAAIKDKFIGILATTVRWICLIFALILVLHIVFEIADANEKNGIVSFVADLADPLTLGFRDIFVPDDEKLQTLVNYGIAAIFWLVVSALVPAIIRRVGSLGR